MTRYRILMGVGCVLMSALAAAGPGHEHGNDKPATSAGAASPRFEAQSELFEVVGILAANELALYVDRFVDNAPLLQGRVELESGTLKAVGEFNAEKGTFRFAGAPFQKPGSHAVTLTITAGDDVDILAANLVVPDVHLTHGHTHSSMRWYYWTGGAAVLFVAALLVHLRRRRGRSRHV